MYKRNTSQVVPYFHWIAKCCDYDINANSNVIYFILVSNANLYSYFVKIGVMDLKPQLQGVSLQITPCAPVVLDITQFNYTIKCQSNGISGRYLVIQSIGERRQLLAVNTVIVYGSGKKRKHYSYDFFICSWDSDSIFFSWYCRHFTVDVVLNKTESMYGCHDFILEISLRTIWFYNQFDNGLTERISTTRANGAHLAICFLSSKFFVWNKLSWGE